MMISRVITSMIVTLRFLICVQKMILYSSYILYCFRLRAFDTLVDTLLVWELKILHLNLVDYFYNCARFEDFKLCNFKDVISKVSGFLKENGDKRFVGICFLFKKSRCTELISFILCKISDLFDRLNKISFGLSRYFRLFDILSRF